jgi:flagellar hook protein FlgE
MLRSLSSAVSGLRNNQTKLDMVGNNIANVNTIGYKFQTARFQNSFVQTLKGASAAQQGKGGTNPMQIGLGMEVSSIDTVHTQGPITSTGRETDLAIAGRGFFVVNDGTRDYYTRDGAFVRDPSGILTNAGGLRLLGWALEEGKSVEDIDISKAPGTIFIPLGEEMAAKQTENIYFAGNLDVTSEEGEESYEYLTNIYDSLGYKHVLKFTFTKEEDNSWSYEAVGIVENEEGDEDPTEIEIEKSGLETISFSEWGSFIIPTDSDETEYRISFDPENGAEELEIKLDFSRLTQLVGNSNVLAREQDGFAPGDLATFNINEQGIVTATYTSGYERQIAQLAMADFASPEGLLRMGSNLYDRTINSGEPRLGPPGLMGRGLIRVKSLEMSNVDLANEFTEMITTSRAFQANTRMISTSDEVLMELVNLKR